MAEKNLTEVPRELRDQFEKGMTALQRSNFDYAIQFFTFALSKEPGFFEARKALRATQFKKAGAGGGFFKKMIGTASNSPLAAKAQVQMRNNPLDAIATCEQILNSDPNSTSAHKVLAEAAAAADLHKTAILSLEIILKNSPKDRELTIQLADSLAAIGEVARAEQLLHELLRSRPTDGDLASHLKNISARRTMKEGQYDKAGEEGVTYRDMLKSKTDSESLEQEKREVKSEDLTQKLIRETEARIAKEPGNLKLLRSCAEYYSQIKDYDKALEYYRRISGSEGATDPSLEKAISETAMKKLDHGLAQLDEANPDHAPRLAQLKAERHAFLLADTQRRAEKYPTDLDIRFELGRLFFEGGKMNEAMAEFQKAQNNPHRRLSAMGYLAQCFAKSGKIDIAAKKFQEAIKEKLVLDDEKKDLIYNYGCVLEKMGKADEAIEQFKLIYEADIGYRDVAAKVDAYYSGR
ncbi:MAG: tetratricopeptide repeat protein [Verrucomicrobia bacterium]|nr:tetratricopeptide repeat protein [Verrucomicrobiota bacterium]